MSPPLKSPVIDHCLRSAIFEEEQLNKHLNKNYKINDYFTTNQSDPEFQNFNFSKRFEYSIVRNIDSRNNLIADQEKIDKMLNYYQSYRKFLYPEFYLDDDIFIDSFQNMCIYMLFDKKRLREYFFSHRTCTLHHRTAPNHAPNHRTEPCTEPCTEP